MQGRKKLTQEERSKREEKRMRRTKSAVAAEVRPAEVRHASTEHPTKPQTMRKRRHHFVWRHYLDAWANSNGRVWCQRRGGTPFLATTGDLGLRKDFYQLKEMSDTDLKIVELIVIGQMPDPYAREVARGWIPMFRDIFRLRDAAQQLGATSTELDIEIEAAISNLEEDLHADIESEAIPVLDALRLGNATVLEDAETYMRFARFLGAQYTRTPRLLANMQQAFAEMPEFNLPAAWGLMRTIFAMNIGGQIFVRRASSNLCFLDAGPSSQFIAGDQPMVNFGSTERLELYYPLTPKRALKLTLDHERCSVESRALTDAETSAHNKRICNVCEEQLYAASEATLVELDKPTIDAERCVGRPSSK